MKASWNGTVLAESDDTVVVEGNHYFPAASLRREYFTPNNQQSVCPWKGTGRLLEGRRGRRVERVT
jgi:uncharacterized protein (DUF427 family)